MHLLWISSSPPSFYCSDEARSSAHLMQQLTAAGHTFDLLLFLSVQEISRLEQSVEALRSKFAFEHLFLVPCAQGMRSALLKPVLSLRF